MSSDHCNECGSRLPQEIEPDTGVYCRGCGHGQLVTDGGIEVTRRDPAHEAVDGGFECARCGATRSTSLGIARHRQFCRRREEGSR